MQWFYIRDAQRFGPIGESEFFRLASEGRLSPDDLVWNPSMGEQWVPASTVPGLFSFPVPPALPPAGETSNARLMDQARLALRGQWGTAVGATLVYGLVTNGLNIASEFGDDEWKVLGSLLDLLVAFFIAGPMALGWSRFFLQVARRKRPSLNRLFDGFKLYWKSVGTWAVMGLYILLASIPAILVGVGAVGGMVALRNNPGAPFAAVLFLLLFVAAMVPAMIVSLNYSQAYYILSDHPDLGPVAALARSRSLMYGFRWKYFCLGWRFLGWFLLGLLSCGIGLLWVMPYMMATYAHFYNDIRIDNA
jgi:uncharacterized membrane protein